MYSQQSNINNNDWDNMKMFNNNNNNINNNYKEYESRHSQMYGWKPLPFGNMNRADVFKNGKKKANNMNKYNFNLNVLGGKVQKTYTNHSQKQIPKLRKRNTTNQLKYRNNQPKNQNAVQEYHSY